MGYGNHKNRRQNVIAAEVGGDGLPVGGEAAEAGGRHGAAAAAMIALAERQAEEAAWTEEALVLAAMYSVGSQPPGPAEQV